MCKPEAPVYVAVYVQRVAHRTRTRMRRTMRTTISKLIQQPDHRSVVMSAVFILTPTTIREPTLVLLNHIADLLQALA